MRAAKGPAAIFRNVVLQGVCRFGDNGAARIGFTATKKLGKANVRNRTKRRLRAVVRELYGIYALNGVDYVLIGRFGTAVCPFDNLRSDVARAFKRVNKEIRAVKAAQLTEPETENSGDASDEKTSGSDN